MFIFEDVDSSLLKVKAFLVMNPDNDNERQKGQDNFKTRVFQEMTEDEKATQENTRDVSSSYPHLAEAGKQCKIHHESRFCSNSWGWVCSFAVNFWNRLHMFPLNMAELQK